MRIFATSRPTPDATPDALAADMSAEVAAGRQFYADGLIVEAYMDPGYARTFMILEAPSVEAARERFAAFPQVRQGLITFEFTPLLGLPAVAQYHRDRGEPPPAWWPAEVPPAAAPSTVAPDVLALSRRFVTEVLGGANPAAFDELVDPDVWVSSGIAPAGPIVGREAYRAAFGALAAALSDFSLTVEDVMPAADGERAAVRWRGVATHSGPYRGMAPTGRRFVMVETHVLRWRGGRLVENHVSGNNPPTFEVLFAPVLADAVLPRQHSDAEVGA